MSLSTKPALLTTDANLEQKVILDCVLKINLHTPLLLIVICHVTKIKPPSRVRCYFLPPDRNDHSNSPQLSVKTGSSIISTRRKNGYHVAHCCLIRSFTFLPDFHARQHEAKILGKEETFTANSSLNANV